MADFWQQAPTYLAPGGGRVTGYQDDPSISGYTPAPKTDRYVAPSYYQETPTYLAPGGGRVTAYQDDPSISGYEPAPKSDRGAVAVAVNPFTGAPIMVAADGARTSSLTQQQHLAFRDKMGAGAQPLVAATVPRGEFIIGKDGSRLPNGANPALAKIDPATGEPAPVMVAMPRRRPNIEDNPGVMVPVRAPDTGRFGVKMSPGMTRSLAGTAGMAGLPGMGAIRPSIMRAPAFAAPPRQQVTARPIMVAAPSVAPVLSNGVANPAYRDYTPNYSSEGGGIMPSSSYSGSFTDSLGGTYYDRHL